MAKVALKLKLVRQKKTTECGAACVAMLTGTSLARAKKNIQFRNSGNLRTFSPDLRQALAKSNIRLGRRIDTRLKIGPGSRVDTKLWEKLISGKAQALVALWRPPSAKNEARWHWVVFDREGVLDPKKSHIRTDYGRMRIWWYHPISVSK